MTVFILDQIFDASGLLYNLDFFLSSQFSLARHPHLAPAPMAEQRGAEGHAHRLTCVCSEESLILFR